VWGIFIKLAALHRLEVLAFQSNPSSIRQGHLMSMKNKLFAGLAAITLGLGASFIIAAPASASTSVNMNLVCQQNMHNDSWGAKLINGNSVYGWKCWNRAYPEQYWLGPFFDADVNYFCHTVEGTSAYFTNSSDPYSWRCY